MMVAKFKFSAVDPGEWWPPDFEPALEMPSNIIALEEIGDRLFAVLEDGRTVDITSLVPERRTKQ